MHKMKVAAKGANGTEYWLMLCSASKSHPNCDELLSDLRSILRVPSTIIGTSKGYEDDQQEPDWVQ